MKNNKLLLFLLLVVMAAGCIVPAQLPLSTATAAGPAATDTLSYTPTPPPTPTVPGEMPKPIGPGDTPPPTYTPPGAGIISHPALATSGPYFAYLRQEGDQTEIVLLDANGIGQKIIPYPADANSQAGLPPLSETLSPDVKWLAYYTGSAGACFGDVGTETADLTLNLMSVADGKTQVVTKLLSPDYPNIFAKAALEMGQADINAEMLQNAFVCGITQSMAWSPDGRYLAFAGQMDGLSSDLYLYDAAAGKIKRLSSGPEEVQWISWSPDGKWILDGSSYSVGEGMQYNIYTTSVDGATIKQLSRGTPQVVTSADWLDDHRYFDSNGANGPGTYDMKLVDVNTGKTVEIWNGAYAYNSFAFVADRNWATIYAYTAVWPTSSNDFMPGPFLINLTTLRQTRVKLPGDSTLDSNFSDIKALGSSELQMFLVKDNSNQNLDYLSSIATLTPTGVQADKFSVSPDRLAWVAITSKFQFFSADGRSIQTFELPANVSSKGIGSIFWQPDDSGLFFTYQDPQNHNSPEQLYVLEVTTGIIQLVDVLMPSGLMDYVWVGGAK